jgi:hypothetical protein
MSFKKNKYIIVKKAISKELANFCNDYFMTKRQVARIMFSTGYLNSSESSFGTWNDQQVPNTYSHYSDIVMETLLTKLLPIMEKETKLKLNPNYSYARIYKKGDILHRHKDRFSCEISTTLFLGGDEWPIFLKKNKEIKINLKIGDMLIYRGNELEHWREIFEGENCAQVFLHYNDKNTKNSDKNLYDKRPILGLPYFFKNENK